MDSINADSKRISEIVSVIDALAFQTNILALNAAVESARAGEQGRGFAVVAGEVRVLAHRSAQAAKEIKTLVSSSVDKIENGTVVVQGAGQAMNDIVVAVKRVSEAISGIASSSHEQTQGLGQVNEAIAQLDGATAQNAALVEQSNTAAQSLRHQSSSLDDLVSVFKLDPVVA